MPRFNPALRRMILELMFRAENAHGIPEGPGIWPAFVRGGGNRMQPTTPAMRRRALTGRDRVRRKQATRPLIRTLREAMIGKDQYALNNYDPLRYLDGDNMDWWHIYKRDDTDLDHASHAVRATGLPKEYGRISSASAHPTPPHWSDKRRPEMGEVELDPHDPDRVIRFWTPTEQKIVEAEYGVQPRYLLTEVAHALAKHLRSNGPHATEVPWLIFAQQSGRAGGGERRILSITNNNLANPYIKFLDHSAPANDSDWLLPDVGQSERYMVPSNVPGHHLNEDPYLYSIPGGLLGALASALGQDDEEQS